ncbi:MAG: aminotransferase [Lachnospiraceae bacterium]|nr:aminotransferase [Candidatus Darwinimomas equi]
MEKLEELRKKYEEVKAQNLSLNMSRGKPSGEQLELSAGLMDVLNSKSDLKSEDGTDCRNYGVLDGIPECKRLMSEMMEIPEDNMIIYGNSSLNIMYDVISHAYTHGVMGNTPWCRLDKVKFLCVVPGYDRHFAITEHFGFENICVPMLDDGPDMDMVGKLVSEDDSVKGIWCVPKYSNPTGNSYSEEVVYRFANLKPAAKDFRIFWDNAYCIHHLYDDSQDIIPELVTECEKAGNPDMVYKFASTSKVTFPGSGIAVLGASKANIDDIKKSLRFQTIGHDKINQLRHVKYFANVESMHEHMRKHADILRPKFEMVEKILEEELGELKKSGEVSWTNPKGGYFISFNVPEGCAKKVVRMCDEAGVKLTGAGATFPSGKDPKDSNIRIAPSFPPVEELKVATELLCLCTKIAAAEK